jgi:SAM-dependent methyltransferase
VVLSTLKDVRPRGAKGLILDIGCGDGLFFDRLHRWGDVEGVEMDATLVPSGSPWRARIHVRPFDESFQPGRLYDLILMLDVLEHLADPSKALRLAVELLEPDGLVVITVPAFRALWTGHDVLNRHYDRYSKRAFLALANTAGVRIRSWRYFSHWTVPLKLAVRFKEMIFPASPRVPRIPPRWINRALYSFSMFEEKTIGVLPLVGSSLLVVAERRNQSGEGRSKGVSE